MNLYKYAFWYIILIGDLEHHTLVCLSIKVLFYFAVVKLTLIFLKIYNSLQTPNIIRPKIL